ncbi:MAG: hypothetical protein KA004_01455 [Verrucomicrobiales bacterium]|nr:hypothetical protein [Verrucomicrobiales bacterium]
MEAAEWHISPCPHCAGLIKLPATPTAARIACPRCGAVLAGEPGAAAASSVPQAADSVPSAPTKSAHVSLPTQRAFDPQPIKARGTGREGWQTDRPLKEVDFKDRLQKTSDPELFQDANANKGRRVKKNRRLAGTPSGTEWDSEAASAKRSARRRGFWRRIPWGIVGIFTALFATALYLSLRSAFKKGPVQVIAPATEKKAAASANPDDLLELMATADYLPAVNRVLSDFFAAETPKELRPFIREPERVFPLLEHYYAEQQPFTPLRLKRLPDIANGGILTHRRFVVVMAETESYQSIPVTLEKTPAGFKVDWESFAGYGEMSAEQFLKERPTAPVLMRVTISASDYFNQDFPDKSTHACLRLGLGLPLGAARHIYGYMPAGGTVQQEVLAASAGHPGRLFGVVRLRYPENSTTAEQVEITEFIQKGWVLRMEDIPMPGKSLPPSLATPNQDQP